MLVGVSFIHSTAMYVLKKIPRELARPFKKLTARKPVEEKPGFDFSQYRMPTWEEDISRNHSSREPFNNQPAPNEMPSESFNIRSRLSENLRAGTPLADFVARDSFPIPSCEDREDYQSNNDARYYLNGLSEYLQLRAIIKHYQIELNSYLDFGCASGRILRHFCAQSDVKNLWGCDINGRHIKWMNEYLPSNLKLIHNHCLPTLPIADESMDVISAYSVFTHIDTFESAWLAELYRILKPNGLVYFTVQNDDSWKVLQDALVTDPNDELLKRMQNRFPETNRLLAGDIPDGYCVLRHNDVGPYRALVFHSNEYLKKTWGRYFDIVDIKPKWSGRYQSLVVGRKL
ncbi:MAG: class I SAM-dependent methyltransferase [Mariniblastus sp.]